LLAKLIKNVAYVTIREEVCRRYL